MCEISFHPLAVFFLPSVAGMSWLKRPNIFKKKDSGEVREKKKQVQ